MTPSRRRALGQHFLRDAGIARAIVEIVAPTSNDLVVEIGPGEGALTGELERRAGRVIALEIDDDLARRLRERFPGVEVIEGDARAWDYRTLARPSGGRVLVVGNLPYSVSKPIVMSLVEARHAIDEMALMLQREVADRLAAAPGGKIYGSLSVMTQLACDVRIALRVSPGAFRPPPKVDSAVVHLRVLPDFRVPIADERAFRAVVRSAFAQRRKTLGNALAGGLGIPAEVVRQASQTVDIDPGRRAETLTILEFARLATRLS
jgi:16S rRNA (adenine1518-N6/adenine1519-N6)-dimethyltransferase